MANRAMKDSGVQAIGEIPEHWGIVKLKHKYEFATGFTPPTKNDKYYDDINGFPWATIRDLTKEPYLKETQKKVSRDYISKFNPPLVKKGSLLYSFKLSVGTKGFAGFDLYTNEAIASFYREDLKFNNYLYYSSMFIESNANENIYGAKILNQELIKNAKLPFPPVEEQQKIAAFLDEKVAHIDNIIEDTKKSIENLKFYKQSLITETVTKGLNPNVDMKDSGIEWAGEIPSHWRVNRLKRIFEIKKDIANQLGYDILSVTQKGLKIKDISSNEGQLSADYSKYQIVEENDFVMNHMDLLTGWVDLSKFVGVTSPDYRVFKSSKPDSINNLFYKYIFQLGYSNKIFYGLGQGVSNKGRWRLPTDQFLNFEIPIPPIEEQQAIAIFLNEKTSHVNLLIEQKEQLINELESYKKSFIYEYVTGKKEVK